MTMKVLLVDDDFNQRKLCRDALDLFLDQNPTARDAIELIEAEDFEQGNRIIRSNDCDAAIVDLRLSKSDEPEGNSIIRYIKDEQRIPVRIVSGYLGDLDENLKDSSVFFDCIARDETDYETIFRDFFQIFRTGIVNILNKRGLFEQHISKIFWQHLSNAMPVFIAAKAEKEDWDVERVLLRYIAYHLQEYLELDVNSNLEAYHPLEYYIIPAIKTFGFTGDVVSFDNRHYFVATPACDLVIQSGKILPNAEYVSLVTIKTFEEAEANLDGGQKRQAKRNNLGRYHHLPATDFFPGGYVDFQSTHSVDYSIFKDDYETKFSIAGAFRKDVVARFASYYGRQGQPGITS